MKSKKYFFVAVAIVVAMAVNFMVSESETKMDALALANVEALATGESNGYTGCKSGSGYCAIYWGGTCIFSSYSHYPY